MDRRGGGKGGREKEREQVLRKGDTTSKDMKAEGQSIIEDCKGNKAKLNNSSIISLIRTVKTTNCAVYKGMMLLNS